MTRNHPPRAEWRVLLLALVLITLASYGLANSIAIDTVLIGYAGNANDPSTGNVHGGVSYAYRIGTTEVTNAQYAAFRTEKAKSHPLGLYNLEMDIGLRDGTTQIGSSPDFSYAPKTNMAEYVVDLN